MARADDWLGHHSRSPDIRSSGLWHVTHVEGAYDPAFLDRAVDATAPP
ncbi:hypothetical protein NDI85_10265 [Halomicroarcula sp. S1AR25-4]|nr:hypothetical protein [Halomicroarcula sp. S1AR25-4]MDS0278179.1 hypothetical protein [Halomicroarcula sp. S1AR25-4]